MHPDFFDNRSKIIKDDLIAHVQAGDKMSVAASVFSMYAYRELREQLNNLDEFRFIYTSLAFLNERGKKEQREFYIPRLDRERGVGGTEALCAVAAIKEAACGIPAADGIDEISVLRVDLKTDAVPERALAAIAQAVPRKLLMVCCHEGRAHLAAMRHGLQVGVQWVPEDQLHITLSGASLAEVWEGLCAQVLFDDASVEDVDARLAKEKRIQELEAQAAQLKRKYAKEVQPSKRNAAFKAYKQAKAELSLLKGE